MADLRLHIGAELRLLYAAVIAEAPPAHLQELVARCDAALADLSAPATAFRDELVAKIPKIRSYALSLTKNEARADDLVQETLLRAWQAHHRFEAGTNLGGWLTTIMRNLFYTTCRKRQREVEDVDGVVAAERLIAPPVQTDRIEVKELWAALSTLPSQQREALLLVAWHNLTYEDAAVLQGCQTGTVKSRVSRARTTLAARLRQDEG
ncbi:sigma-70 family RNA polymerase sigma factor [Methylobacterium oryzisoli]|uniref:sigma-70 family RNA polymerase sigma factor n=1 Tax=Methylobacterium oryzisoli TaxID=3385502 RepID=UPI0038922F20